MTEPKIHVTTADCSFAGGSIALLGAIETVTPASSLLTVGQHRLLVDCGVEPAGTLDARALGARALVLTHAHFDHAGGLPELLAAGRIGAIFATRPTLEITRLLIKDSIHLKGGSTADYLRFKETFKRLERPLTYDETFEPLPGCTAQLVEAGHILGSASLEVKSDEVRVIFSGDLGRPGTPLLRDYNTNWSDTQAVDVLVMESTYGNRQHNYQADEVKLQLRDIVNRAVTDGGHILIPAFAIGRTQQLLSLLNDLAEAEEIPALPVVVDTPMGLRVTGSYRRYGRLFDEEALERLNSGDDPIDFDTLFSVRRRRDSKRLDELTDPVVIIAGSGMLTGGRMAGHMVALLGRPETNVVFAGFQSPGTPGHELQQFSFNAAPGETTTVEIMGETVEVAAHMDTLHGISAHADQGELVRWYRALPKVEQVLLHHGTRAAQEALAKQLEGADK